MGTKTVDETGAGSGTETKTDEEKVDVVKTTDATDSTDSTDADEAMETDEIEEEVAAEATEAAPSDVGQGAGAVVSAALGLVSLTGGWLGTVAAERQSVIAQLESATSNSQDVAKLLDDRYGDVWHVTALWGGLFALAALIVGVVVLARPAFGAPGKPQATWIKSVAWGGVSLGVIGLLLAVLKYLSLIHISHPCLRPRPPPKMRNSPDVADPPGGGRLRHREKHAHNRLSPGKTRDLPCTSTSSTTSVPPI